MFLRTYARVTRLMDKELRSECGLPAERYEVLLHLWEAKRPLQMHDVADSLFLSRSGATRFVDRLEEAGLVTRESVPGDRRCVVIALTPRGLETLQEARTIHHRSVQDHFTSFLTRDEVRSFCSAFTKILRAAEGAAPSDM